MMQIKNSASTSRFMIQRIPKDESVINIDNIVNVIVDEYEQYISNHQTNIFAFKKISDSDIINVTFMNDQWKENIDIISFSNMLTSDNDESMSQFTNMFDINKGKLLERCFYATYQRCIFESSVIPKWLLIIATEKIYNLLENVSVNDMLYITNDVIINVVKDIFRSANMSL